MILWIIAGYCLAAVLFYGYLMATAEADPTENATVISREDRPMLDNRKAA